jgi:chromosome segregation ATPase
MEKNLKEDIEAVVASIFSEKEESDIRKKTEAELQKAADTIDDLTSVLEDKKGEFSAVSEQLTESTAKISSLETELEAARKETEEVNAKLSETENALEEMKKDQVVAMRISELDDAKVSHSNKEAQATKIRDMSDDEFAAYKEELAAVRQLVIAELEANKEEEVAEETPSKVNPEKGEGSEEEEGEVASEEETEEEITPPVNVDPGDMVAAALNMEVASLGDDVATKYSQLGDALAAKLKKDTEL